MYADSVLLILLNFLIPRDLNNELSTGVSYDKEIQDSELRIQYLQTTIDTLTEIVNNLTWRHQTISNMIKWRQFETGI